MDTSRIIRAGHINALRHAIRRARLASDALVLPDLQQELKRLELAEIDDYQGVEDAPTTPRNSSLVNFQIVRDWVRSTYQYDGADPLTVAAIDEVTEAGSHGEQAGDFWVTDEVTGCVVRVVKGDVQTVWKNQ